ncbi:MAG: hypothetical protein KC476_08775 [Cyanobacteria bacterium HKST-UBA06]|nr:hypothetical protein [Cyanobacteria bacterium HKST-UBA06]
MTQSLLNLSPPPTVSEQPSQAMQPTGQPVGLDEFADSQPFATRFFTNALDQTSGSHLVSTYLLLGQPLDEMGQFAMRLAQIINCQNRPNSTTACGQCQPCSWIAKNRHPDVITLTNTSYLWEFDKDKGLIEKTSTTNQNISVKQVAAVQQAIGSTSPQFIRVVIVAGGQVVHQTDSETVSKTDPETAPETEAPNTAATTPTATPRFIAPACIAQRMKADQRFELVSLNHKILRDEAANKFLKTLEEPPANVLFFLLCDDTQKVIDTIRSRCQTIPFRTPADNQTPSYPPQLAACLQTMVLPDPNQLWLDQTAAILHQLQEAGLGLEEGLDWAMHWAWQAIVDCADDRAMVWRLGDRLRKLADVRSMLRQRVRPEACLDELILSA